jgi:hypothetical protein
MRLREEDDRTLFGFVHSYVSESGHGAPRFVGIDEGEKKKQILRSAYPADDFVVRRAPCVPNLRMTPHR